MTNNLVTFSKIDIDVLYGILLKVFFGMCNWQKSWTNRELQRRNVIFTLMNNIEFNKNNLPSKNCKVQSNLDKL